MFVRILTYVIFLLVFSYRILYADISIFLIPNVNIPRGNVRLDDIAKIEGPDDKVNRIRSIQISRSIYSDGFVERRELHGLLDSIVNEKVLIYGNAVRITSTEGVKTKKYLNADKAGEDKSAVDYTIRSGDNIKLIIIKNGIKIEVSGIAMADGSLGDIIPVKINGNKRIKGKIVSSRMVEKSI